MRICGHQVHEDITARIVTRATQETSRAVIRNDGAEEWGRAEGSRVVWGLSLRKWSLSRDLKREEEERQSGASGLPAGKTQKMPKELSPQTQGRDPEHSTELHGGQITAWSWR